MAKHNELGHWGEAFAAKFLENKGYTICERDWHYGKRDIDIIAFNPQHNILVFVEVKTRADKTITHPTQAVDKRKIKNIAIAANSYVKERKISYELRFDIISVIGHNEHNAKIEHIEDAFNPMLI